ncbi:hypothetical protein QE397_003326 [Rhodococcus sp. SORGH_AS 301]|nr:hypothetical protein [Rhodococcus sp. SORGH_AS_0301]
MSTAPFRLVHGSIGTGENRVQKIPSIDAAVRQGNGGHTDGRSDGGGIVGAVNGVEKGARHLRPGVTHTDDHEGELLPARPRADGVPGG